MSLYLVGDNIDKTRSHYLSVTGRLTQLMRGVYVDATDDVDAMVLKHAIRIAKYLYPHAYLSAASAILLAPTADGRLFLAGRRRQRTRLRSLEIIQNDAPKAPSIASAIIDDGMGEFRMDASSIRQRFLESFRSKTEHAAAMDEKMREALAERLVAEYGSTNAAADAVYALARANAWYKEGEQSERFLTRNITSPIARNEAALDLAVAWHGTPIGNLTHDGFEWRWQASSAQGPALVRQTTPGKLPPFILSLLPEGWLESVLRDRDERTVLRSGKRYMSNITIVENKSDLATLPPDTLAAPLEQYSANGLFTGIYAGPGRGSLERDFERNLAQIYERSDTPRLSGIQIKAPMFLDANGRLSPSEGTPFTHILKPAGTSGFELLPIVEWVSLALGKAVGFEAPSNAIVTMPDGMPPALLIERFDIRKSADDTRMLALEDLCSVLDLPSEAKYTGTIERIASAVRPLSTAPEDDLLTIFKRALFAWLIADGDMHLKNMALLKTTLPGERRFTSVRMAPLYDAVTTRVFPGLEHDRMALKLNGKDTRLQRADFLKLANTAGIRTSDAETIMSETIQRLSQAIENISLPDLHAHKDEAQAIAGQIADICRAQIATLTPSPRLTSVTGQISIVSSAGQAIAGVTVTAIAENGTTKNAVTLEDGIAAITVPANRAYQLLIAHPEHPGTIIRSWNPNSTLTVTLPATENTGSVICHATVHIPGLEGRLNPILDAQNRMYLYADNIAINGGAQQPVPFQINTSLELEDSNGIAMQLQVLHIQGDTSLLQYAFTNDSSALARVAYP